MAQKREKKNITCKEVTEIEDKLDEFVKKMSVYEDNYTLEGLNDKELCSHIHALESKFDKVNRILRKVEQLTTRHVQSTSRSSISRETRGRDFKPARDSGVGSATSAVLHQPEESSDRSEFDEEPVSSKHKDVDRSLDVSKGLCLPMKSLNVETSTSAAAHGSGSVQEEALCEREPYDGTQVTANQEQKDNFHNIHDVAQTQVKEAYERPKVNFPEENLESHDDNTLVDPVDSSNSQRETSAASSSRRPSLSSNPINRMSTNPHFLD